MGQTRVDLRHLLEDLRDAYPGSIEETILTEIVANSLDSGASRVAVRTDQATSTLMIVDDGSGMRRRELARYHDLATSTKIRGKGIGFAGVGVKLGLLICKQVITETRRDKAHVATSWSLTGRHKAPWHWLANPPGAVGDRGTAICLSLSNPLSPLLDGGFLEGVLRRHYEPLLDARLAEILLPLYRHRVTFEVNGRALAHDGGPTAESASLTVRLSRRRKPSAVGWVMRSAGPLPEESRGIAVSTYGKVIKRGWDWLGVSPAQSDRITGLIEAPALAQCLTLNKGDFIRTGTRGSVYLAYRRAIQEAVVRQLAAWGDAGEADEREQRRAARPVERDLENVLVNLADDFPMLASLVDLRLGGQRKLAIGSLRGVGHGAAVVGVPVQTAAEALPPAMDGTPTVPAKSSEPSPSSPAPPAAELPDTGASTPRRPARYALTIHYESQPEEAGLARLVDTVVWVNEAHPAYRRAVASRSEGYHLALCVAMALAPLVTDPGGYPEFIAAFLRRWGKALDARRKRRLR
jgi:hypothetical protein